jgi:hypothetical protein
MTAGLGAAVLALGGAAGAVASVPKLHAHSRHRGRSASDVVAEARSVSSRVIVVLRNQHRAHPASAADLRARVRLEARERAPLFRRIRRAGGRITHQFRALNAFAATVTGAQRAQLRADPAVARVVPDAVIRLPRVDDAPGFPSASANLAVPNGTPPAATCPSDPAKPLLEPEALQTTHTAFTDPATPQAQSLATGKGVKVAFFADGLDTNNPDFVRADGSKVFIDYKDFSGDGPDAVTGAAEAFGDASSIAAQGRQVYDLADFVNPAHPLPPGCNITVRGISPGASLIGIKVFGNASSAFNSTILEGLDYALTVDHADIFSESFGEYPIPDSTQDLTRQFNEQAVAAGATVVESTGDSGVESSVSSAASDPAVIAAGASTNFRNYAQTTSYGFQLGGGGFASDNISSIESAGVDQGGHVHDLVAPGEAGWALCSPNIAIYEECTSFAGTGSPLQQFGGTSESAPFIAGGAALIVQAYRDTHGGATPSPALVKQLLTSTANDLGFPSEEEGAGEMDTLKAVQAASSLGTTTRTGHSLVIGPTQLDISGPAGSTPADQDVTVTNTGADAQTVTAQGRTIATALADATTTVQLDATKPTFIDQFGAPRPFQEATFTVPAGADRLVAFDAWPGPKARIGLALVDPDGNYAAYTRPQGDGNHGEVDVHHPTAGTWKAIVFIRDGTFSGPVHLEFTSQRFGAVDTVTPSSLALAPGQTGTLHLHLTLPDDPGDTTHDLVIGDSSGDQTVVPVVLRSMVALDPRSGASFEGTLIGGNGRAASPGQLDTFAFDVPAGEPELAVSLRFADDRDTQLIGTLVDPEGNALSQTSTTYADAQGNTTATHSLQAYRVDPRPGRWHYVVDVTNPVGGNALEAPYRGRISLRAPRLRVHGVPDGPDAVLRAGRRAKARIEVFNDGAAIEDFFVDPRLQGTTDLALAALTPPHVTLPLKPTDIPPLFLMPTQTSTALATADATEPVSFDFGFGSGDPDVASMPSGNTASAAYSAPETANGIWFVAPAPVGPFAGPAPPGSADVSMVATARPFDDDATPSTGDVWRQAVDPNAPFTPVTIRPGHHETIEIAFTPHGPRGSVVDGTLFVDDFSAFLGFGDEAAAIPYHYRIG